MTKNMKRRAFRKNLPLFLIAVPGLVYLLINNYIPMFGIYLAFKKITYPNIFTGKWCGFDNFKFLFQTNDAWIMIRNTVIYNLVFIVLGTVFAVFIAILMSEVTKYFCSKVFQAGIILPNLVSMVIVAYLVYAFLNPDTGLVNNSILKAAGKSSVNWYTASGYWPFIIVFVQIWKSAGYSSIVYIASIAGIDKGLYEAARLDGAGKMRQIFSVTLPQLRPTIIMMVLMSLGRLFSSDFGLFYQVPMNSGPLFSVTQTIDTYVYRGLMTYGNPGMSSAAGLFQSIIGFILVITANAIVRKIDSDNALF